MPHINPKRWVWEQTTIADCPYDYFTSELKSQYYDMFRSQDGASLIKQECGSPSHDKAGTASGGWFQGDDTDSGGEWLELGNINGKTELLVRNSGKHVFSVRDYQTKTLPDSLLVGSALCYSEPDKWAYVRVDSDSQLTLATGAGSCPTTMPSAETKAYYR